MNTTVNFQLAKLLQEKKFNDYTKKVYLDKDNLKVQVGLRNYPKKLFPNVISAPTIAEVIMWFYKKHNIWISVEQNNKYNHKYIKTFHFKITKTVNSLIIPILVFSPPNLYNSPIKAYIGGIKYTLKKLL